MVMPDEALAIKLAALSRFTYVVVPAATDRPASIVCLRCGAQSFNPHDIAERYCGRCHVFHDDAKEAR